MCSRKSSAALDRRVPPRWIAASRCVCTAWRDAIDARGLLRADLLPLSLAGLFIHFDEHKYPEFLARPPSAAGAPAITGNLSFLPSTSPHCGYFWQEDCADWWHYNIDDHCNGLLLLRSNRVVNPATRCWSALPPRPAKDATGNVSYRGHLIYDPMISPYYEVFMTPRLDDYHSGDEVDPSMEESEWPPSPCKMYVFSSKSGRWEEKYFFREGGATVIVSEMRVGYGRSNGVYYRGALYVHCRADLIMRISLSDNTYSVIKPPVIDTRAHDHPYVEIVRSKKGVYFVAFDMYWPQCKCWLGVWIPNESCGQMEWMLKHDKDLKHALAHHRYCGRLHWILEDINYNLFCSSSFLEGNKKATTEENFEWNSDDDIENKDLVKPCCLEDNKKSIVENKLDWKPDNHNALNDDAMVEECYWDEERCDDSYDQDIEILGFHPYKEIVYLSASQHTALAYNLNGSKIEELGNRYPEEYLYFKELGNERERIKSFPYTPCWIEEFPGNN
ncbi:hypothetical protein CFC21_076130 [Triticum aestivum]|uniref:F-box domain-containing protein n=3 Tax=Triticinae TaxID=1648030 RepID=A0A9R1HRZ9_WHEAT|nr:uncharacterized protein LOC123124375 isoform X1 [Triticum aestivum]KAF7070634.1 hypothetical protein CFC21_076128 [Triticum aestivum]KAF7070637.1 hypothetical protein CFC21_076130 [Triticum aestivum]